MLLRPERPCERLERRRTRVDVTLAGAACKSIVTLAAALPAEPVMEGYSELWVVYRNGAKQSWVIAPCKAHSAVWGNFIKWFHGREQSAYYVMRLMSHYNIVYGNRAKGEQENG